MVLLPQTCFLEVWSHIWLSRLCTPLSAIRREVLALMLRYVGAVCGVIYSILLPLMVHIMVVSTHSLVNTGRFVRPHPSTLLSLHTTVGRSALWTGTLFDGVSSRVSLSGCAGVLWVDDVVRLTLPHTTVSA
jgi:hypothetical protein